MPALEKRPPLFTGEEYARRIASVRVAMDQNDLDALIITDPANMCWLTGYDAWSFYVHQAVILTKQGAPQWWGRGMDAVAARVTCWMADGAIHAYPDSYVHNPDAHPYAHLAGFLRDVNLHRARIGVELDTAYFTAACIGQLLNQCPNAKYLDATGLVNWRRVVKSDAELALMRQAARIVEGAHALIRERIEPGMRKNDLIAEIVAAQIRGGADADGPFGGDYTAIVPMAPSGAEAAAAHITWDDRPFESGEATFFEIAGCRRRYHCPQSRTVFLGAPDDAFRRVADIQIEGLNAAVAAARPGAAAEDVEGAFRAVLEAHGVEKESRIGYSAGLAYPPDWGERTLSIRAGDRTELQPGMTLHVIPALWEEAQGFGVETTETILITETGAEALCATPREVFVKP